MMRERLRFFLERENERERKFREREVEEGLLAVTDWRQQSDNL